MFSVLRKALGLNSNELSRVYRMNSLSQTRLLWSARRGMLELDLILSPFITDKYDTLSDAERITLAELLTCTDVELYAWLTEREAPPAPFALLVKQLLSYARRHVS